MDAALWRRRLAAVEVDSAPARLGTIVQALVLARTGDERGSLALTAPLLAFDEWQDVADPFARATLHLLRGRWQLRSGEPVAALRSWRWAANQDLRIVATGVGQAADVDWVLGADAVRLQLEAAARASGAGVQEAGMDRSVCADADRVLPRWDAADAVVRPRAEAFREARSRFCPR